MLRRRVSAVLVACAAFAAGCARSAQPLTPPPLRSNAPPESVQLPVAKTVTPSTIAPVANPTLLLARWIACAGPSADREAAAREGCAYVARHVGWTEAQLLAEPAPAANAVEAKLRAELVDAGVTPIQRIDQVALLRAATAALAELARASDAVSTIEHARPPRATAGEPARVEVREESLGAVEAAGQARFLGDLWAFAGEPSTAGDPQAVARALAHSIGAARVALAGDAPMPMRREIVEPALATLFGFHAPPSVSTDASQRWFEYANAAADALLPRGWLAIPSYVPGRTVPAHALAEIQARRGLASLLRAKLDDALRSVPAPEVRRAIESYVR